MKQSSKYGDSGYNTEYGSLNNRNARQQQYREPVSDESNSNLEEYQIEGKTGKSSSKHFIVGMTSIFVFSDIEREIQRKSPEEEDQDHYRELRRWETKRL